MKILTAAVLLVAAAVPAMAQNSAPAEKTYFCWYNDAGNLTGATIAEGSPAIHYLMDTGRGGSKAWAYAIHSTDGKDCPTRKPE